MVKEENIMKITKSYLKQMIMEELGGINNLSEEEYDPSGELPPKPELDFDLLAKEVFTFIASKNLMAQANLEQFESFYEPLYNFLSTIEDFRTIVPGTGKSLKKCLLDMHDKIQTKK